MEAVTRSVRYRINISTSVKGVKTWECTIDATGFDMDAVLVQSDALVEELEKRYPLPLEQIKKEEK